jgi:two-component system, NarL family, response regulator NreC
MIRLVIADDHGVMRDGLRAILGAQSGITVVGEAADGVAAIRSVVEHKPNVLLLDLSLPLLSGLDVLRELRRRQLDTAVLVLSMHAAGETAHEALRLGARGYLQKGSAAEAVIEGVRAVAAGQRYLPQEIASKTLDAMLDGARAADPLASLSDRERSVMRLVCEGKTSAEIAALLNVSPKTIDTYRSRLMQKLGIDDLPALVKLAIRTGVISAE